MSIRKMRSISLIFISILNVAFAADLEFVNKDGAEFNSEGIQALMVTEHLKAQGKLIQDGAIAMRWASYGNCQEVWQTDKFTIICGTRGVWKYDKKNTRAIYFEPKMRPLEIHSCQPLKDGGILIAVNKVLLELNPGGKITRMIKIPYLRSEQRLQMKTVRKLSDGGYVISGCAQNKIYILNKKGMVTRTIDLDKIELPAKVRRIHGVAVLDNGNVLVGTGYGASLVEIDKKDKLVWSLTAEDLPTIGLKYVGSFVIRENGNIIVAAYNSAYPMFEVDRKKNLVWKVRRDKEKGIDLPTAINFASADF
nr:hypothetical protein [Lentisphaera araneosa]